MRSATVLGDKPTTFGSKFMSSFNQRCFSATAKQAGWKGVVRVGGTPLRLRSERACHHGRVNGPWFHQGDAKGQVVGQGFSS